MLASLSAASLPRCRWRLFGWRYTYVSGVEFKGRERCYFASRGQDLIDRSRKNKASILIRWYGGAEPKAPPKNDLSDATLYAKWTSIEALLDLDAEYEEHCREEVEDDGDGDGDGEMRGGHGALEEDEEEVEEEEEEEDDDDDDDDDGDDR